MLLFLRKRLDTVGYVLLKVVEEEAQVANASESLLFGCKIRQIYPNSDVQNTPKYTLLPQECYFCRINRGMPNHEHPSCPVVVTNYQ